MFLWYNLRIVKVSAKERQYKITRYSDKAMREVPEKDSDVARRRTKPADRGAASPKAIDSIYKRGKIIAQPEDHIYQKPQGPMDMQGKGYDNDVAKGWLRGSGVEGATARPTFDHSEGRGTERAKGLKASGQDMHKSPFSRAHYKGNGEGF